MAELSGLLLETPPTKLKITFNARHTTDALASANRHLALDRPQQALRQYTSILTDLSPGHPVAFLNRCLCYLVLGYPNLAVIDAYRAFLATEAIHMCPDMRGRNLLFNLHKYTTDTSSKVDIWKSEPHCYIGKKTLRFLDSDLACIRVSPHRRVNPKGKAKDAESETVGYLTIDVRVKAMYRIALSLWKCGGGAMKSALDWCISADRETFVSVQDHEQFDELSHQILLDIETELNAEKEIKAYLERQGRHSEALDYCGNAGLRGLMDTKFTTIKRELFPWDEHSLSILQDTHDVMLDLNREIAEITEEQCRLQLKLEEYPNTVLSLVADKDLGSFEELLMEKSHMHAVFPKPLHYCDTCCSGIRLSHGGSESALNAAKALASDLVEQAMLKTPDLESQGSSSVKSLSPDDHEDTNMADPESRTFSSPTENGTNTDGDHNDQHEDDSHMSDTTSKLPGIPFEPIYNRSEGFQICPFCQDTAFCDKHCSETGGFSIHRHLCKVFRRETPCELPSPNSWNLPSTTRMNLLDQLMQGLLANLAPCQKFERLHDFQRAWMRMLGGDVEAARRLPDDGDQIVLWDEDKGAKMNELYPSRLSLAKLVEEGPCQVPDSKPIERMPWSFNTNVLLPIETLLEIGTKQDLATGYRVALDCRRFDGWILETFRFKTDSAMRVSRFPRTIKDYDKDLLLKGKYDFAREIVGEGIGTPDVQGGNMWMASLHPKIAGIRKAKTEVGEVANVQIVYREGLVGVRTIKAVKRGEEFLY